MLSHNLRAVHPECRAGYLEDRRHGLIYGPYGIPQPDGSVAFGAGWEFASIDGRCLYCKGEFSPQQYSALTRWFAQRKAARALSTRSV